MSKPVAPACERNQQSILDVLQKIIVKTDRNLLEVGSGTGQHAVFMAPEFSHLHWHTSDLVENHCGIEMWMEEAKIKNLSGPHEYETGKSPWVNVDADVVFTANTLHIMAWENVLVLIKHLGENLKAGARVVVYGPFNYAGKFTSKSNEQFEQWLKMEGEHRGIRDFEKVATEMLHAGLSLLEDFTMPANNRILVFRKN